MFDQIIQEYNIPRDLAKRWADICSGFPREAHMMGWNLMNNPEDLLKPPALITSGNATLSQETNQGANK